MAKADQIEKASADSGQQVGLDVIGVIDVGSNSIRLAVAQVKAGEEIESLESFQQAVRLGQDTFRRGRLGLGTMRAAVSVLREYKRLLNFYEVKSVRAVATSAVREAVNSEVFLDRIFMATGLDVEILSTSEESRLIVSAVQNEFGVSLAKDKGYTLIAEVSAGGTLLTLLKAGQIEVSQALPLGSIRLQEIYGTASEPPARAAEILQQHISTEISGIQNALPLKKVKRFIAIGGDARFAAREVGKEELGTSLHTIGRSKFEKLAEKCHRLNPEELSRKYGVAYAEAETLNAAFLVYEGLMDVTPVRKLWVSMKSLRDGLLLDVAGRVSGQDQEVLQEGVVRSAMSIAEKYRVDLRHGRNVQEVCDILFTELQSEHGLSAHHRLLLQVASWVHEVGGFVSPRAHHKHSYYLVSKSEIFGLTTMDIAIVAHVSRYHRRSVPKPSHLEYMGLTREGRMVVCKLAAILRIADALDALHGPEAHAIRCERRDDEFVIYVSGGGDLTMERRSVAGKGDLFEDIYGMKVRLEDVQLGGGF